MDGEACGGYPCAFPQHIAPPGGGKGEDCEEAERRAGGGDDAGNGEGAEKSRTAWRSQEEEDARPSWGRKRSAPIAREIREPQAHQAAWITERAPLKPGRAAVLIGGKETKEKEAAGSSLTGKEGRAPARKYAGPRAALDHQAPGILGVLAREGACLIAVVER